MTKRQAIKQAAKRGLVSKDEVRAVAPTRHRRTCPACGHTFLPLTSQHKGFCCACCASVWGELRYAGTLDRRVGVGVEVILLEDGAVGRVAVVTASGEEATIKMADGRKLVVGPRAVERIQYLTVRHVSECHKDRPLVIRRKPTEPAVED